MVLITGLLLALAYDLAADESAEAICKNAGQKTDGPSLLEYFKKRTASEAAKARLADLVTQLGDKSFRVREKASAELVAAGRMAVPFLQSAIKVKDLEIARRAQRCLAQIENSPELAVTLAAAQLLALRNPPGATEVILDYLPSLDDDGVEEELLITLTVVGLGKDKAEPCLLAALKAKHAIQRSFAALVLGKSKDEAHRVLVRPLLADPDAKVRLRAAQGLIAAREKEAVPALLGLLENGPLALAWQAEELLYRLAGEKGPAVALGGGSPEERRLCRDAWNKWWTDLGSKVDLAKLDLEPRLLGLTLVVSLDGYGGNGRIWECAQDTKPRWEIRNVKGPIDAIMVAGNRVLIAEYYANLVTERDQKGKIWWQHACQNPVSCQRLPTGNTLIANNKDIIELTPNSKQVFSYSTRHGEIFQATKLRNQHVVYLTFAGVLAELDATGKEIRTIKFERPMSGRINVDVLPSGRFLIPLSTSGKVAEFDSSGKIVWSCSVPKPNSAQRLPNGNTLVCSREDKRVVEVDRAGKVVWEFRQEGHLFRAHRR
jgi:hypothetical protein